MKSLDQAKTMKNAPLPVRDGVAPSRVYLPPGPWKSLFEFLTERFAFIAPEILYARLEQGDIVDAQGVAQRTDSPYKPARWLWYYREVPNEPHIPFALPILYQDDRLVVVDKPHFLASTPGGRHLRETALSRLRHELAMPWLTPMHRLDRETAGVMLFCADPASRGAYQTLFQSRAVKKEYEAVAPWRENLLLPRRYRSRLCPGSKPFFMREVPGDPNSETHIDLLFQQGELGHYRLLPLTGRKHQLRVHMSALNIPICHDRFYPEALPENTPDDFSRPLQLLARAIEFKDPFSARLRRFESHRTLAMAWTQTGSQAG